MKKTAAFLSILSLIILSSTDPAQSANRLEKSVTNQSEIIFVRCSGCGCRGGPGWRVNKTGKCASKKNLYKKCGKPPSSKRCTKEN